jgi:hypothetical protein
MTDEPTPAAAAEPAPPSAEEVEATRRWREKRFEMVATLILGLTALVTAWSGYQASIWDGIQSSNYSQASAARTEAAQLRTEANQYRLADLSIFQGWATAKIDGDEAVRSYYEERFRAEFRPAFDAWMALDPFDNPDAPATPLTMPEYVLRSEAEADALEATAEQLFADGEDANDYSDVYTLATLLFAVVLFFAAISERFEFAPMRITLLSMAGIGLVAGVIIAASQPVTTG